MRRPGLVFCLSLVLFCYHDAAFAAPNAPRRQQTPFILDSGPILPQSIDDSDTVGALKFPDPVYAWRFNTSSMDNTREILKLAKRHNADVWSISQHYVDMRLPGRELPSELSLVPSTPIFSLSSSVNSTSAAPSAHQKSIPSNNKKKKGKKGKSKPTPRPWPLPLPDPSDSDDSDEPEPPYDLTDLDTPFHSAYHTFDDIIAFANDLARTYPHLVELVKVGQSSEDREILAIKIESYSKDRRKLRERVVIQGAQHARDWVATATALYFAHTIVVSQSHPRSMNALLDHFAFTIIPVPNPDGYIYTWEHDRLWYKNRMPTDPNNRCLGVDMNRNWGFHWDESTDPCHHWYGGGHPFEAPEVNAIASYIERTPGIKAFIDLRSYGQMLVYPFSYTCDVLPGHAEDLIEAALGAAKASKQVHGMSITTGSACELLYSAPGSVIDWAYATAGVAFSYSIFLRDTGTYGFMLPETFIRPVGEETAVIVQYLTKWLIQAKH